MELLLLLFILNFRSRLKIHHQMHSDDPNVIEYRTFYIRDLEAKLDAYR